MRYASILLTLLAVIYTDPAVAQEDLPPLHAAVQAGDLAEVERLLEAEDPASIPSEKRDRVEFYLASLDPESLGNRWKSKVYRRGGEVMLSKNGHRKALEYFERALDAADRDEIAEVERIVENLREKVDL